MKVTSVYSIAFILALGACSTDVSADPDTDQIALTGSMSGEPHSLNDAWIHAKIVAKLISNSQTPARRINVDVTNHVVTLRGHVESPAAREQAEQIARGTYGVRQVMNRLKVHAG